MANIGTLAVNVVARTGKFLAGMQSARKSLNSFAMNAKSAATSTAGFASGLLALGAGAGFAALTKNAFDSIDATGKLSKRLNIATEDLIAFQHGGGLAGVSTEQLSTAMEKFVRNVGDVRTGSGQAAATFQMLGLSADELANMDTGQAIRAVADEINKLPTAADKASAATKLFGKSGAVMLQLLEGGSGAIDDMRKDADKLGKTFSELDSNKVQAANDSFSRLKDTIGGAFQTLAVNMAPAITAAADKMTEFVTSGDGLKEWIPSLTGVSSLLGVVADVIDVAHDSFLALAAGMTKAASLSMIPLQYLYKGVTELLNVLGMDVDTQFFDGIREELDKLANEQWEDAKAAFMDPPPSEGIKKFFDDAAKSADKAAKAMLGTKEQTENLIAAFEANQPLLDFNSKLEEQIAVFGMSNREAEISRMASAGASAEFLNQALALDRQMSAMEASAEASEKMRSEMESLASEGVSLMESLRTPAEQFDATIEDLFRLQDVGAIGQDTFNRAAEKAKMEFAESMVSPNVPTGAAAIDARSAEGISRLRNQNKDPMKDALKVAEQQLDEQKQHRAFLAAIAKNTSTNNLVGVSIP